MSHLLTLSDLDIEAIEQGLWGLIQDRYEETNEAWAKVIEDCPVQGFFKKERSIPDTV